jgi:hypothetical protein
MSPDSGPRLRTSASTRRSTQIDGADLGAVATIFHAARHLKVKDRRLPSSSMTPRPHPD